MICIFLNLEWLYSERINEMHIFMAVSFVVKYRI